MKSQPNPNIRASILAALVAVLAALAIPVAASAQDPAGDQYAPATPNGGGDYDFEPTPSENPEPASAADSGSSGDSSGTGSGTTVAPTAPGGRSATPDEGNRDQRTVSRIGAAGEQARETTVPGSGEDVRLAGSDASTSAGLGAALWILIAAALMWAIGIGVVNYRRRGSDPRAA